MDGRERNDGIVVIGTTNDIAAIEPALKDRPSRFDVVLELAPPSADARRRMFERFVGVAAVDDALTAKAAEQSEGMSGAQMRELAFRVVHQAILRGSVDGDGLARAEEMDLQAALAHLHPTRQRKPLGFGADHD